MVEKGEMMLEGTTALKSPPSSISATISDDGRYMIDL